MPGLSATLILNTRVSRQLRKTQHLPAAVFHTVARLHDDSFPNHYVTLGVTRSSPPKDIKSKFYQLSKTHHPDRNRGDTEAANKFVKISNAYHILSDPTKRERYDRDYDRHFGAPSAGSGAYAGATGPAGGRPASGLSRRRTQQGAPPPSFFRNATWNGGAGTSTSNKQRFDPAREASRIHDEVPHFDKRGHARTQANEDVRRQSRQSQSTAEPDYDSTGMLFRFLLVGAILGFSVTIPFALAPKRKEPLGDK